MINRFKNLEPSDLRQLKSHLNAVKTMAEQTERFIDGEMIGGDIVSLLSGIAGATMKAQQIINRSRL